MPKKITITCPSCSATLAAPISAAGKTLLCPKCRTGIPVPLPVEPAMTTNANPAGFDASTWQNLRTERAAVRRQQTWNTWRSIFRWLSRGLAIVLTLGVLIWGVHQFLDARQARAIVTLLEQQQFDPVLALEPDHIEALIGRSRQQLEQQPSNVAGAIQDLEHLKRLVPEHPIHKEILPALSMARSRERAMAGDITAALKELEKATKLGADEAQLNAVRHDLIAILPDQAQTHVQNQRFREAVEVCRVIEEMDGQSNLVMPIQTAAWEGLAENATTPLEFDEAIGALEILRESVDSMPRKEKRRELYIRGSRLMFSQTDFGAAIDLLKKSAECGRLDPDALAFGTTLADSALVVFGTDLSDESRDRARQIIDLLEKEAVDAESLVALKTRFSNALLSQAESAFAAFDADHSDMNRDRALLMIRLLEKEACDAKIIIVSALRLSKTLFAASGFRVPDDELNFTVQYVTQFLAGRTDPFPDPALLKSLSRALGKRSFEHLREGRIPEGIRDFTSATEFDPQRREKLVTRQRTLPANIRDQLPEDILGKLSPEGSDLFWKHIPANAEAFSAVRRMEEFSDKVDAVAHLLNIPPPRILDLACRTSEIRKDVERNGTLGWVKLPTDADATASGMVFFVPTTDFPMMTRTIRDKAKAPIFALEPDHYAVQMEGLAGLATPVATFGAFAFANDQESLLKIRRLTLEIRTELIPLDLWDQDLDSYFIITRQGLLNGIRDFNIPFSTPMFDSLVAFVRRSTVESSPVAGKVVEPVEWLQQLAIGLEVQPDRGIGVRSRFWVQPEIDLEEFLSENTGGRERALNLLPNGPILLAVGGPVSPLMCEELSNLAALLFPEQPKPQVRISSLQFALLAPDSPAIDEVPQPDNFLHVISRLLSRPVVVVRVKDSRTALDALAARFTALAGPAPNADQRQLPRVAIPVETVELDGIRVLRIQTNTQPNDQVEFSSQLLFIAAPDAQTLVSTSGDDAQLDLVLAPFRGAGNLSESETVFTAVRMLPDATSWLGVLDLKTIVREILRRFGGDGGQSEPGKSLAKAFQLDTDVPGALALGMSWQESDLDLAFSFPNEVLPLAGGVLPFVNSFLRF